MKISQKAGRYLLAAIIVFGIESVSNRAAETKTLPPSFSLAWSEYPSWSVFGVAHSMGLINGEKGKMGEIEKRWNVDIVLKEADYDSCITMFSSGDADAACLTDMDVLSPSLKRRSVGILPTSTSFGADALLVENGISNIRQLRGQPIYGLAKSVSEYCFARNLELLGEKESDHQFKSMDPGAAATAMIQKKYNAIVVWNPFVLSVQKERPDIKRLFDSTSIPGEIVDMVQMGQDSLDKPGGKEFACAVIETFYQINHKLADPKTREVTLKALGRKFAKLDVRTMEICCQQTLFYSTPQMGIKLLEGNEWATPGNNTAVKGESFKPTMKRVVSFCVSHEIVPKEPKIGFGNKVSAPEADFRADPSFIQTYLASGGK